jgi:hypothetical protein
MISRQRVPINHTKEEGKKISEPQDSEGNHNNKKKSTEKNNEKTTRTTRVTTTDNKSNTFDLTKSDNTSTEIIDILDEPDVAVWSKGIMNKTNTPADKVQEPSHIKSIGTDIKYGEEEMEQKQSHLQQTLDPANKEEVAKAIDLGTSLTDEATTTFIQKSKKEPSS